MSTENKERLILGHFIGTDNSGKIILNEEPSFSITKEQLRKLTDPQVKEWFPEVFKVELEVGKWYRNGSKGYEKSICCVLEIDRDDEDCFSGYGFDCDGDYFFESKDTCHCGSPSWKEATQEEVFEALKNEAIKRGFGKKGVHFTSLSGEDCVSDCDIDFCNKERCTDKHVYNMSVCQFGGVIYRQGKWAEIIPTITKAEAEKELNKKIID